MLKKLITLAATTAMLGANAAAYAINTARSAVKTLSGTAAAGEEVKPGDGTRIQPSIPPMPPMEKAQPAPRKVAEKKVSARKGGQKAAKSTRARKASGAAKAAQRKPRSPARHASR